MVIDIAAVAEAHDHDQHHIVVHGVADAVVADADAKTRPALQGSRARRARVLCQQGDRALNALSNLRIELAQGPGRCRAKLEAVFAHTQPRSALTCSQGMFGPSSAIAASKAATSSVFSSAVINCS